MFLRRVPVLLRHAPVPGMKGVVALAAIESAARGILLSVYPITLYNTFIDAETVSEVYLMTGIVSFIMALMTPSLSRLIPRRWLYTIGALGMACGTTMTAMGGQLMVGAGLTLSTASTVVVFVCFNAYVMDYVERTELTGYETRRLFYSGACWAIGPFLGIWLMQQWEPAPFVVAIVATAVQLAVFWYLRLGNGKVITKAQRQTANPLAYLPRFFQQPRLVAGYLFAIVRSMAWWIYIIYVPIYVVEVGYSEEVGGFLVSLANAILFITPLMLKWMQRRSIRRAVILGFLLGGILFVASNFTTAIPEVTLALVVGGAVYMVLLDISAGLPFLMAVKPSERTEMSAVYSTFRDLSGAVAPGLVRGVLIFAPVSAAFAVAGVAMLAVVPLAMKLHPKLGQKKAPAA